MDWNIIIGFIKPELLIIVVLVWLLGLFLKQIPDFKAEWTIPFILLVFAIIFTILYIGWVLGEGFAPAVILSGIIQGVIIAALAVFGNEIIKQTLVKRLEDGEKK